MVENTFKLGDIVRVKVGKNLIEAELVEILPDGHPCLCSVALSVLFCEGKTAVRRGRFFCFFRCDGWVLAQNRDVLADCAKACFQAQDGRTTRKVVRPQPS